jgi:histidinol-phosphate aminotransferase
MALRYLRPGLPASYAFSVNELACAAKLDQNESPLDVPAELKQEIASEIAARGWNRYLQPAEYLEAKRALAAVFDLPAEAIAITVGADQAIEAGFLLAGGPGRRARWFEPTYPYLAHAARRTFTGGGPIALGSEIDQRIDAAGIGGPPPPDLVALVAPNNPTGGMPPRAAIEAALAEPRRLLLLDEAYADFAGETMLGRLAELPNLLVARSLSKSALAGVHVGFLAGHPEAIAIVERLYTSPYHLSGQQLVVSRRYGELRPHVEAAAASIAAERARVAGALAALPGASPQPSRANFILFRVEGGADQAGQVHRRLAESGVRIRDVRALAGLESHLRVTIGTRNENDLFLHALAAALAGRDSR